MNQQKAIMRLLEWGKNHRNGIFAAVISAVVGVLLGILPYIAGAKILEALADGTGVKDFYVKWCLIGLGGYLGRTVFYTKALSLSHKSTFAILKDIRQAVLEKLPRMPLGTILDTSSGKMKQIIVDQVESMETTLAHLLPEMTSNILGSLSVVIYFFTVDWRMALISLISMPVGFACMGIGMKNYTKDFQGAVDATGTMNETLVEYIGGIEVIKAFNQGEHSYAKFTDKVVGNAAYYYNWMKKCQLGMALAFAIAPTTLLTVLPAGWIFYVRGTLSAGTFLACIMLSMGIVGPLIAAMSFSDNLAKVTTIVGAVDDILSGAEQDHGSSRADLDGYDIELDHVSFGYHADKEILHDINLSVPANSLTALVGPSGSGKSTIAKLIAGFWDVEQGKITLGGTDEKEIPLEQLYDSVAFVTQENYLFDDTVMENIRMGRSDATDEEVIKAAERAGCGEFILGLENGYNTKVGGGGGAHLSGGERQRVAIARAMLKDAPVIILDEATAYIDPENEVAVQRAVGELVQNKTVIIVAHRLSTITGADKIVVVNDGRIQAQGKHEELLESCPLYKNMWEAHIGVKEEEIA